MKEKSFLLSYLRKLFRAFLFVLRATCWNRSLDSSHCQKKSSKYSLSRNIYWWWGTNLNGHIGQFGLQDGLFPFPQRYHFIICWAFRFRDLGTARGLVVRVTDNIALFRIWKKQKFRRLNYFFPICKKIDVLKVVPCTSTNWLSFSYSLKY